MARDRATDAAVSLSDLIDRFAGLRVAVFGDLIADEFVYGRVARISREAPVLILEYDSTEMVPAAPETPPITRPHSGRGSACRHGRARRAWPSHAGGAAATRRQDRYRAADRLCHADQDTHSRRRHSFGQATGRAHRSTPGCGDRCASRRASSVPRSAPSAVQTRCWFPTMAPDWYGRRLSPSLRVRMRAVRRHTPVLIDSRYALTRYKGLTACTPNESEVEQILGIKIDDDLRVRSNAPGERSSSVRGWRWC